VENMDNENISIKGKENMENSIDLNELKKLIPINGLKTDLGILSIAFIEDSDMWVKEIQNTYEEIQTNWKTFPHIFPTLNGHKFFGFGTEKPGKGKYYLCGTISENDPTSINGLERRKITFGNYLRHRINGEMPELYTRVGPAIGYMLEKYNNYLDGTRPIVEYYRSSKSMDCLMPLKEEK
jgi:DNA gyrase inhibitor GyrI